jgi:hypothetical protein
MVMMQPSIASIFRSSGFAVISLLFSPVAICPKTSLFAATKALTTFDQQVIYAVFLAEILYAFKYRRQCQFLFPNPTSPFVGL